MANTSARTLRLLSLPETRRYWPGAELAARLQSRRAPCAGTSTGCGSSATRSWPSAAWTAATSWPRARLRAEAPSRRAVCGAPAAGPGISADPLRHARTLPVHIEPGLSGPDHGEADGRPWDEIKAAFGGPAQSNPDRPYAPWLGDLEPLPDPRGGGSLRADTAARGAAHPDRRTRGDRGRGRHLAARPPSGLLDAGRLRIRSRVDHPLEHAAQPVRPGNMDTRRPERHPAPGPAHYDQISGPS